MNNNPAMEISVAADAVANEYDAEVFFYNGPIEVVGFGRLVSAMQASPDQPRRPNAFVIMVTPGGLANAAYKIARLLQNSYVDFHLCIPARCKSAGTLVALGAHTLHMGPASELGPLDVQLLQDDEIGGRKSGLLIKSTFEALADDTFALFERFMLRIKAQSADQVTFRTASDIATQVVSGVMAPVYAQINPNSVGSDYRDVRVAEEYGRRLADRYSNPKPMTIDRLVNSYPSHDFVIDKNEAKSLFRRVEPINDKVHILLQSMGSSAYVEGEASLAFRLDSMAAKESNGDGDHAADEQTTDDGAPKGTNDGGAAGVEEVRAVDRTSDRKPGPRAGKKGSSDPSE